MLSTCIICFDNCSIIKEENNNNDKTKNFSKKLTNKLLLHSFCRYFDIRLPLKNVGIQWNFSKESLPFCEDCKKTALKLVNLDRKLKMIQKSLKDTGQVVKQKIQASIQPGQHDSKDVRVKMLRDLIVLPHINLNRINDKRINSKTITVKIDSSSIPPPLTHHAVADFDDQYFDDYSPPPFNDNSTFDEPDENSNSNNNNLKRENPLLDEQLYELNPQVENGPASKKRTIKQKTKTAVNSKKRKVQNVNISTNKKVKIEKTNKVAQAISKFNEENMIDSVDETISKSQTQDDDNDLEVIDEFGMNMTVTDNENGQEEEEEEDVVQKRPKRKSTGKLQKKNQIKEQNEEEEDDAFFVLDDEMNEEEEAEEEEDEFEDDLRDEDFILPDDPDILNTLKEDLKLSRVVKSRLKEREKDQKDPNRIKKTSHSAKKLEDGVYEYCGFRFTGTKAVGYTCSTCPTMRAPCTSFKNIYRHIKGQHIMNKGGHICTICNKTLARASGLRKHLLLHEERDPWICDLCGRGYKDERGLESHKTSVHFPENLEHHICEECGKTFKKISLLNIHKKRVHQNQKRFFCPEAECGKGFFSSGGLYRHSAVHLTDRPFECEKCGQTFRRAEHRSRHFKQFHDFKTSANCRARDNLSKRQRAEKRMKQAEDALMGIQNELQDEPQNELPDENLKCEYCGLQYNRQNNLTRHILNIHKIDIKGLNWKSRNRDSTIANTTTDATTTTTTTTTTSTTATSNPLINSEGSIKPKRQRKKKQVAVEETNIPTANTQIGNMLYEQVPLASSSRTTSTIRSNDHSTVPNNWNMSNFHNVSLLFENSMLPSSSTSNPRRFSHMNSTNASENNNTNGNNFI